MRPGYRESRQRRRRQYHSLPFSVSLLYSAALFFSAIEPRQCEQWPRRALGVTHAPLNIVSDKGAGDVLQTAIRHAPPSTPLVKTFRTTAIVDAAAAADVPCWWGECHVPPLRLPRHWEITKCNGCGSWERRNFNEESVEIDRFYVCESPRIFNIQLPSRLHMYVINQRMFVWFHAFHINYVWGLWNQM